jgi:MFS transporter, DHA1 family, inner membrane transport protein
MPLPSTIRVAVAGFRDCRRAELHEHAYAAQCAAQKVAVVATDDPSKTLALLALALGSFCIGTSEFASMGVLQLFAADLSVTIPKATWAITAYALGVVVGSPVVTLAAARLNRRTLLVGLMGLFAAANLLSSFTSDLMTLALARFAAGLPQGGYFGAGAVVASYVVGPGKAGRAFAIVMTGLTLATVVGSPIAAFVGQHLGWRDSYRAIAAMAVLALIALLGWTPRTSELNGGPLIQELRALGKPAAWGVMIVAAIGVGSIFAIYTFIGPLISDAAHADRALIPFGLALFGIGMTLGNWLGAQLADSRPAWGVAAGYGSALAVLALLALAGEDLPVLLLSLFGVGATMMMAILSIQVCLARAGSEAPTLMGAMNLASLNVANALGAWLGGISISLGFGLLSVAWVGFACTLLGLMIFGATLRMKISYRRLVSWATSKQS